MQLNSPGLSKDIRDVKYALTLLKAKQHCGAFEKIRRIPGLEKQLPKYATDNPTVRLARKAILCGFEHCFGAMGLTHLPCERFFKEYCELSRQHVEAWRLEQAMYARNSQTK